MHTFFHEDIQELRLMVYLLLINRLRKHSIIEIDGLFFNAKLTMVTLLWEHFKIKMVICIILKSKTTLYVDGWIFYVLSIMVNGYWLGDKKDQDDEWSLK